MILAIIVYWCVASAPFDAFNPHQVNAASQFVRNHPDTCGRSPAEEVTGPRDVEHCRAGALLNYAPSWQLANPGKVYIYADCIERRFDQVPIEAAKRRVGTP